MSKGVVYQNKDAVFKILCGTYKEQLCEAYGLALPRIRAVLPTNLPAVSADEKRMDNLFLLEDDALAIVDYELEINLEVSCKIECLTYLRPVYNLLFFFYVNI